MFPNKVYGFLEVIEVFSKSKAITSPNVTSVFKLMLK